MSDLHSLIYSEEVLKFVRSSQNFANWLEEEADIDSKSFIISGLRIMPELYSQMISIPPFDPVFNETSEKFVTEEDWAGVYQKVANSLGVLNDYDDIAQKTEYDRSELVCRKISEDISDIYQDIRDFLEIFRNSPEEIMNDGLWECRSNFESSWGGKVLRVSKAMHEIYISDDTLTMQDEEINSKNESVKRFNTGDWIISKRQQEYREEDEAVPE